MQKYFENELMMTALSENFAALAAGFGDRLQLGLPLVILLVARSRLLLEPLEQCFLGFLSTVKALLNAGAFWAAPHALSLRCPISSQSVTRGAYAIAAGIVVRMTCI